MIGLVLFLAFTVIPALELWLLIELGGVIGGAETVAYVIALGLAGAWLGKRAGFSVARELAEDLRTGKAPADRLVEGALVLVGSVLLITPGVLTDATGVLLFIGPFRRWLAPRLKRLALRALERRGLKLGNLSTGPGFHPGGGPGFPKQPDPEKKVGPKFEHPVR